MKWFHSLRWRLLILFFLVSYIPLMFFSSILLERMETYYLTESETNWRRQANMVSSQIKDGNYLVDNSNIPAFKKLIASQSTDNNCRILVVDASGFVVMDSSDTDMNTSLMNGVILSALSNQEKAQRYVQGSQQIMMAAAPVSDKDKKDIVGAVMLVASIDDAFSPINDLKAQVSLISIVIALVAGLLSFATSSLITKPLKALMRFVQKITNGQLDQKVNVVGKDEIAELGNAFNHMAEQLQRVEQSRQEFVSNVSHELKTPLSSIKVLTESLMFQDNVPIEMYEEFLEHTGITKSELINYRNNPVDKMDKLLESRVPVIMVYGDSDDVVPYCENGEILEKYYREHGGVIEVYGKKGCGHHPHGLEDTAPIIDFTLKYSL